MPVIALIDEHRHLDERVVAWVVLGFIPATALGVWVVKVLPTETAGVHRGGGAGDGRAEPGPGLGSQPAGLEMLLVGPRSQEPRDSREHRRPTDRHCAGR